MKTEEAKAKAYEEALALILEEHKKWLDTKGEEGTPLNLEGVDLEGARLEGTHLEGVWLDGYTVTKNEYWN